MKRKPKITPRRLIWIALSALFVVMVVWAYRPKPIAVETARVSRGQLSEEVVEEGKTRLRDRFVLHAPVTGTLDRIDLEPGMKVRRGDVLARMRPSDAPLLDPAARAAAEARVNAARDQLEGARAQLNKAETSRRLAEHEAKRTKQMFKAGALAAQDFDRARYAADAARAEASAARAAVRTAAHELENARAALGDEPAKALPLRELVSPVDGEVLKVQQPSEGLIQAGAPVIEVGTVKELEVVVPLLTRDAVPVRSGMRVQLERWGGPRPLRGRVRWVEPSAETKVSPLGVEEQRVNTVVDLEDQGPLGDGFAVDARIVVWESSSALQVSSSALFRHGEGWAVFALRDGRAVLTKVSVGHRGALQSEVVNGLAEGDEVIVHPPDAVKDGAKVRRL